MQSNISQETQNEARKPLEWAELWKAMDENPGAWIPTTPAMYDEMLNVLPPAAMGRAAFLVGEPNHHNANGEAVYACFRKVGENVDARYMTRREFQAYRVAAL